MASGLDELGAGDVFHSRYRVERKLAEGGMGAVYEVLDERTQRRRALKVMLAQLSDDDALRRRFRTEATVAAAIDSEHIAEVVDAGIDEPTASPFIVLELLKGQELSDMIEEEVLLAWDDVLLVLGQIAGALDRAHAQGVVHRDLKPENLFLTRRDDGSLRIKILDFGIAKVIRETIDHTGTKGILGTPAYMASEQIDGEHPISARTDGHALAQVAYTLVVGEAYWTEELETSKSLLQLFSALAAGPKERPSLRAWRREHIMLPDGFDDWFAMATAANPAGRFVSMAASVRALSQVLTSAPSR